MSALEAPFEGLLRIGAFAERLGVSESVLRAWEARYGLFTPVRTPGGFRLYSRTDEVRARRMLAALARGLAARESAELALRPPPVGVESLISAWAAFDAAAAHTALDGLLGDEAAVAHEVLPALATAADLWTRDDLGPAQVAFACRQLETRLLALGERWHEGPGPLALVGCGPGDHHTLGVIAFALALHRRGWRIAYLGAEAPVAGFAAAANSLRPAIVVMSVTLPWVLGRVIHELPTLAAEHRLLLAGGATDATVARRVGAAWLSGDPISAAASL